MLIYFNQITFITMNKCILCNQTQNLKLCLGCEKIYYCSKECQRKHWNKHKIYCEKEIINSEDLNKKLNSMKNLNIFKDDKENFLYQLLYLGFEYPLQLKYANNIEIRKSNLHGKGVFAKTNIPKNTIITFYPAHAIQLDNTIMAFDQNEIFIDNVKNKNYAKIYGTSGYSYNYKFLNIIGNPDKTGNKLLLGHMLNDVVGNIFNEIAYDNLTNDNFRDCAISYLKSSFEKINCEIKYNEKYPLAYVITTKDINKDDELLIMYGFQYWYDYSYNTNCVEDIKFKEFYTRVLDKEYVELFTSLFPQKM